MKKIDLSLNYIEIKKRIELDKANYSASEWAARLNISKSSISNIHGKGSRINPSLEYIIAVARFMGKSIEWYLYGNTERPGLTSPSIGGPDWSGEDVRLSQQLKNILDSKHPVIVPAIVSNLAAFELSVEMEKTQAGEIKRLKKRVSDLEDSIKQGPRTDCGEAASSRTGKRAM